MMLDQIGADFVADVTRLPPRRRRAANLTKTVDRLPGVGPTGGQQKGDDPVAVAPGEREAMPASRATLAAPLAPTIAALVELQRQRVFCIKSQSRCDRSTEAFIARFLGFRADADEKVRKLIFAQAAAMRKGVEKGRMARLPAPPAGLNGGHKSRDDHSGIATDESADQGGPFGGNAHSSEVRALAATEMDANQRAADALAMPPADGVGLYFGDPLRNRALDVCTPIILNSAAARQSWDVLRNNTEKQMRRLARSLPAWQWVDGVSGFSDLGLAIIVGEGGDIGSYATKERVWKRLGLAVIDGERQQRRTNAEEAAKHGYSPRRRAEIWTVTDSLFKHQWAGAKEDAVAGPTGPYGAVYAKRKAHTATREGWTPKRRDNDARRIMCKALLEDLWRVWRGKAPLADQHGG